MTPPKKRALSVRVCSVSVLIRVREAREEPGLKPVPGNMDAAGRGAEAPLSHRRYFVASERAKDFALIFPEARFEVTPPELPSNSASRDDALLAMVTGWIMQIGRAH